MAEEKTADLALLTRLLAQQMELAQESQRQGQLREERLAEMMERMWAGPPAVAGAAAAAPADARPVSGSHRTPRLPASATPAPQLSSSASLKEFESWRQKFAGYTLLTGVSKLAPAEQKAALFALLDDDWTRVVRYGLPVPEDADIDTIIAAMQAHLRRQRNVIIDRRDFFTRVQEPGETVDDFLCGLKEIASFCDFCHHCLDNRFRDRIVVGTRDEEARRRMLEEPDLTLQKATDIARASENAAANSSAIRGSTGPTLGKVSQYQRSRSRPKERPAEKRCPRCGGEAHRDAGDCRAVGQTCRSCGKLGHYASVCRGRSASRSRPSASDADRSRRRTEGSRRVSLVSVKRRPASASSPARASAARRGSDRMIQGLQTRRTPQVQLLLHRTDGRKQQTVWTPDTGAEVSVISLEQAKQMGIIVKNLTPSSGSLFAADGRELPCLGSCDITLQLGDIKKTVNISVVRKLHSSLLSWHDAVHLGILHKEFPQQIRSVTSDVSRALPATAQKTEPGRSRIPRWCKKSPGSVTQEASQTHPLKPKWDDKRGQPSLQERKEHFSSMKKAFPRVFDVTSTLRKMSGGPMDIQLTEDAKPAAVSTARNIPFCWREDIRRQLDDLLEKDIIEPVEHPTEWCHPIVPVAKRSSDGTVSGCRLTVDLTKLNRFVKRPAYPVRSPHDAVASIGSGAMFYTKLDSKSGYHQIPICEEDQDKTCFITPWGRFRYKRAVMGLVSSGDEYNRRGDAALGDVPQTCKVVDDILAYDTSYSAHLQHVWDILQRCEEHGMTLNPEKCSFAEAEVEFCGFKVNRTGYTADNKKVRAIAEFPQPACLTDMRSFLGLVNQLGDFSPDVAVAAEPLRHLLRPKNAWVWTPLHTKAFDDVKKALVSPPILDFFSPRRRTVLETDAARLRGLGFCLRQQDEDGRWRLIQCGSRFLSDVESRYAVCEIEMLAVAWACRKCSLYLSGMQQFEVVTDHRPLIPVLNSKSLLDIENPRLQRLRERLTPFNFVATWRQGKMHAIPDALSRAPVDPPTPDDEEAEKDVAHQIASLIARLTASASAEEAEESPFPDATLEKVRAAAERDPEYITLKDVVLTGFPDHKSQLDPLLRPYWGVRDRLAVDDSLLVCGQRLLIPQSLRRETLVRLHASHQGVDRTKRRARQVVYWPGLDQDIANLVGSCESCQLHLPSQPKEPLVAEATPTRVFESVSADYFSWAGRAYLVYADRLSGWPFVFHCTGETTARDLVSSLRTAFAATGAPSALRTDGGPQFVARHTRDFLRRWGVTHQVSTPHFPQSNGHAEAAVKAVKRLVKKICTRGDIDTDEFAQGLLELRNTPRADGRSPAQVLYGRPLRSAVPAHHRAFADSWQRAAEECDKRAAVLKSQTVERYDASAHTLKSLQVGKQVLLQDPKTGLWDRTGAIVGVGNRRDYHVRLPSGRTYWRNRRYLRPLRPMVTVSLGGSGGARNDCSGTTRSTSCDDKDRDNSTRCDKNRDDDTVADTGARSASSA